MTKRAAVSVVVIFLDAEQFIEEAIESVFAQTYPHWELLLVDDGSQDRSTVIARGCAVRHPERVRYIEHPGHAHRGTSPSRNLGLAHARGDYVAFLDADDVYLPRRLETHVALLEATPHVDMVQSDALRWFSWSDAVQQDHQGHCPFAADTVVRAPSMLRQSLRHDPLKSWFPATCSVTIRRPAIIDVRGFEEEFTTLCEDWVFFSKMYLKKNVLVTPDVVAKYRKHPGSSVHRAWCDRTSLLGQRFYAHVAYLRWLKGYIEHNGPGDPALIKLVRRKLWPEDNPLLANRAGLPPALWLAMKTSSRRLTRFLLSDVAYQRLTRWRQALGVMKRALLPQTLWRRRHDAVQHQRRAP